MFKYKVSIQRYWKCKCGNWRYVIKKLGWQDSFYWADCSLFIVIYLDDIWRKKGNDPFLLPMILPCEWCWYDNVNRLWVSGCGGLVCICDLFLFAHSLLFGWEAKLWTLEWICLILEVHHLQFFFTQVASWMFSRVSAQSSWVLIIWDRNCPHVVWVWQITLGWISLRKLSCNFA